MTCVDVLNRSARGGRTMPISKRTLGSLGVFAFLVPLPIAGCSTPGNGGEFIPSNLQEQSEPVLGTDTRFGKDELAPCPAAADADDGGGSGGGDAGPIPPNLSPLGRPPEPLPGLTPQQLAAFQAAAATFQNIETVADGLGPVFNGNSCGGCHSQPGPGGGSAFFETRFGRSSTVAGGADGGPTDFDPLA